MSDLDLAWGVEEACLAACPSPREIVLDGRWLIRIAGGATRRTNSVNPLRADAHDPSPIIDVARRLYDAHDQPLVFRVPSIAYGLDAHLDRAGFTASEPVSNLAGPLDAGFVDRVVEIGATASDAWLAAKCRMSPKVGATPRVLRAMIDAIMLPKAFAAKWHENVVVAVAYGVVHGKTFVLEAVVTDPCELRRGHARAVVRALLGWARLRGAEIACLQVEANNRAAIALYRRLGFDRELYRYRYFGGP